MDWGNLNILIFLFFFICAVTLFTDFFGELDAEKTQVVSAGTTQIFKCLADSIF